MPTQVQFRRGTTAQNNSFTGAVGELSIDTDKDALRIHDGTTSGGFEQAKADLTNVSGATNLNLSGITTTNSLSIGSTQVISSARQLQNIVSLDATTTATIESAVAAAPNDFTSLNISGLSTFSGITTHTTSLFGRDASFSGVITATSFVGAITGAVTGTATSTTNIPNLTGAITSNNTTTSLGSFSSANLSAALTDETGTGVAVFATSPTLVTPVLGAASATSINSSGIITASTFSGNLANTLTLATSGTGLSGSTTFNNSGAATFTVTSNATNANTVSTIVARDASGNFSAGTITASLTGTASSTTNIPNLTGAITSVNTATSLGSFTSLQLLTALSDETGSGAAVFATSPTLVTPVLGTPSSGTLTSCTGLPVSTGISGLGANVATFLATPSSANLISAVTDETGTGALVFATSPTLVTPALGTPSSGTLTSCTGLPITGITSSTTIGLGVGSIELGHATDTTITRVSAGLVAIEGVNVVTVSATQTLTNKTLTSPTLTTPALGTPASGTLTSCTGLPLTTGVTGTLPVANGGTGVTASTGTGSVVLSTSPTLVTPALGTPTSGNLANCTFPTLNQNTSGSAATLTTGRTIAITGDLTYTSPSFNGSGNVTAAGTLATVNSNVGTFGNGTSIPTITVNAKGLITGVTTTAVTSGTTITDDTSTNATRYLPFTSATSGSISAANVSSTKLTFNPSTGALSATDFNSTSDISLKDNIQTIINPLDKIIKLNGVTFNWKENQKPSIGVIAQELQEVLPELVTQGDIKSVNYNGLIGVLIEAVKEQQKQIDELKAIVKNQ